MRLGRQSQALIGGACPLELGERVANRQRPEEREELGFPLFQENVRDSFFLSKQGREARPDKLGGYFDLCLPGFGEDPSSELEKRIVLLDPRDSRRRGEPRVEQSGCVRRGRPERSCFGGAQDRSPCGVDSRALDERHPPVARGVLADRVGEERVESLRGFLDVPGSNAADTPEESARRSR